MRRILLGILILSVGALALKVAATGLTRAKDRSEPAADTLNNLPVDVESVQQGFRYSEAIDHIQVDITGNRIVRRGRKVLGLRSTLVKTNFFSDVSGTLHARKDNLEFSASKAEWDMEATRPFILQKDVVVTLNGQRLPNPRRVKIYLKQGVLEVSTDTRRTYRLL